LACGLMSADSTQRVKPSISTLPLTRTSSLARAEAAAYAANSYPLPNRTVIIDGFLDDWQGIAPVFTDPKGDIQYAKDDGSDSKALYAAKDESMLYLMIEFYGKANVTNYLNLYFNNKPSAPADHFMFGRDGFISWSKEWLAKGVRVGYRDVAEIGFPLTLLVDFAILFVNPMVYIPSIQKWDDSAERWVPIWIDETKGISVNYRVTIHKASRLIEIYAHANNLGYFVRSNVIFKFNSHWVYPTSRYYLVNLTFSSNKVKLSNQLAKEDVWNVSLPENAREISAHYFLNVTREPAHSNYFGEDFIVAHVGSLFIYPDTYGISNIRFKFELPSGWLVAAQWDEQNGYFATKNVEYIKRGFVAIGGYEISEFQIGNVTLVVAVHPRTAAKDLVEYSRRCFSHLMSFLKYPFADTRRFLVIFAPPPSMCGTADFCGPSCTVDSMTELMELWVLPHEMFHVLDGIGGGSLEEGVTQYYGYKSSLLSGMWDHDRFYRWLTVYGADGLQYYYTEIWGTQYNLPIVSHELDHMLESTSDWQYTFVQARKMAIVAYMLNKEIEEVTNGSKSLDDVISYLNAKCLDPTHSVKPEEYLQTVNLVAGYNFTDFFGKYIYGSDWLPPVALRDWFDWYINATETLVSKVRQPNKESLSKLNELKSECDKIINLIYEGRYREAFSKIEGVIQDFKYLLKSIMAPTVMTTTTATSTPIAQSDWLRTSWPYAAAVVAVIVVAVAAILIARKPQLRKSMRQPKLIAVALRRLRDS